jgi:hypothetical protein
MGRGVCWIYLDTRAVSILFFMAVVHDHLPSSVDALQTQLASATLTTQLQLLSDLAATGEAGSALFMDYLRDRLGQGDRPDDYILWGTMYQALRQDGREDVQQFLQDQVPDGVVPLRSDGNVDYRPLFDLLAQQSFEAADRLTIQLLCENAGAAAIARKWLYFTEVDSISVTDLRTIDRLWLAHSQGKFGFSVQRELWLGVRQNWDALWPKIGWRDGNNWTRYPGGFTWDLSAPRGHLPLSNQLRGVRVMAALMKHPAWTL